MTTRDAYLHSTFISQLLQISQPSSDESNFDCLNISQLLTVDNYCLPDILPLRPNRVRPVVDNNPRRVSAHEVVRLRVGWLNGGRGAARAEDAQRTPTQSHISPSILVYEDDVSDKTL